MKLMEGVEIYIYHEESDMIRRDKIRVIILLTFLPC
jgi:hypothetical protein